MKRWVWQNTRIFAKSSSNCWYARLGFDAWSRDVEKSKKRPKIAISAFALVFANMRREAILTFQMPFLMPGTHFWRLFIFILGWSKLPILPGLEPGIPWFVVRCLIHWATGPKKFEKNKKVSLTKKPNVCEIFTKIVIYAIWVRCMVARSAPYKKRSRKGQKSQYRLSRSTSLICAGNRYRVFAWFFFVG